MGGTQTVAAGGTAPRWADTDSVATLAEIEASVALRRPVVVSGPPRVGKTTLVRAATCGRRCYVGGGLASLSSTPYLALTRALRRPPRSAQPEHVADEIEAAVADGVLVVDDLQWCDPSTHAVVAALSGRIAVVGTVRPGEGLATAALTAMSHAGALLLEVATSARPPVVRAKGTATLTERIGGLSLRELEVLDLVAHGLATPEIGIRLGVARTTVETHVAKATSKLGAANRREAAVLLRRLQL